MISQTDTVNTNNWREAMKGIEVSSYIERHMSTSTINARPFADVDHYNTLRRISVPYLDRFSANEEDQIEMEFRLWDDLSDEALLNFETELIEQ